MININKNKEEKYIVILSFILICIVLFWGWVVFSFIDSYCDVDKEYKKHIGNKVIIDNLSYTIVDYSTFNQTFTLSNGTEVNYKLIFNKNNN